MARAGWASSLVAGTLLLLVGCATRPINLPMPQADPGKGYRFETRQVHARDKENLVVLAFSGGGTRAAAFSYGVLEFLRRTEVIGPKGNKVRLLDEVDVITGVSGGSFTALAYALYGDKLFTDYEQRFLKRNVQGDIIARALNPVFWPKLTSTSWGRSELAAELYDEILFNGATFGDLDRGDGPLILVSATDISTGARFTFTQGIFDVICSDLNAVPLSRAAAASSAVPVVLSSITINNYGGTCNSTLPAWVKPFVESDNPPRPAARAVRSFRGNAAFGDSVHRPYLHLVDGGVADNVGMRTVLDALEVLEALHDIGARTPLDSARRIVVFIVNSHSSPPTKWDESEAPRHRGYPAQGSGNTDRSIFLRIGRTVERHRDALADLAPPPGLGRDGDQHGPCGCRRDARPGRRDLCNRRVVRPAERRDGTGLSEPTTNDIHIARRRRRSLARRSGNDHRGVARISASPEGYGREGGRGTSGWRKSSDRAIASATTAIRGDGTASGTRSRSQGVNQCRVCTPDPPQQQWHRIAPTREDVREARRGEMTVLNVTQPSSTPRTTRAASNLERPYSPGWFDRLTDWIDRMPGPNVLYFLGLLVFQFAYVTGLLWSNGKLPVGSIDLRLAFIVVVTPYLLWVRFYLDRVAAAALDAFRPVLAVSDAEFLRLRYELTTLPARTTRLVTSVAISAFLLNAVVVPDSIVRQYGSSLEAALIVIGPITLFTFAVAAVSTVQAIHQLRMVERIYDLVGTIALLRAKPLYAFSQLTARTGVSFLLLAYYIAAVRPDLVSGSPALQVAVGAMVPTAVACFDPRIAPKPAP
jgi:NTE family protein